jgi:hypothetical protein
MKKIRYILFLIIMIVVLIPIETRASVFPDLDSNNQNYKAINYLHSRNILNGYSDGYFRPYNPISRIELLKIIMNSKGLDTNFDYNYTFPDIDRDMWYASYVSTAYKQGYVNGNNGYFYPNNTVTKAESLKIIFNIFGIEKAINLDDHVFPDVNMNEWYAGYFKTARDNGFIDTPEDEFIYPHSLMNRGEISEIIYRIISNGNYVNGQIFEGAGTYTVSIGDKLYDEENQRYIHFTREENAEDLRYNTLDEDGNILKKDMPIFLGKSVVRGEEYEYSAEPLENTLMNHRPDGQYRLEYLRRIDENQYEVKFDYALRYVDEKARGIKKILFVPIYLPDQIDKVSDHNLRIQHVVEPALEEIKAYIKTKQLQYLGEEIMWFDFTITDYLVIEDNIDDYYGGTDGDLNRLDLIKERTPYKPDDFDIIFYRIYTTESQHMGLFANFHRAQVAMYPDSVTDWDLSNNISLMQQRSLYNEGGLHEILHNFGMTDLGRNQGKAEQYIGDYYDGTQQLCIYGTSCPNTNGNNGEFWGEFQHIDDFVAHEIGWTDRNNNGIWDFDEYKKYSNYIYEDRGYYF